MKRCGQRQKTYNELIVIGQEALDTLGEDPQSIINQITRYRSIVLPEPIDQIELELDTPNILDFND